ncbi:ABC transporter ATP-binding protein [Kitasatospora sp. A2-31]|uniref:ATP-binding cassette domain-containing protein n=1 Tax=Kitasatospora sp. A2-31 TaxID=2916414 RepID=UPI001EEA13BB|nr:ABC transporter ATP-binding protein [Kitasatospora sp. A2-31]MCG6495352.1 ABC transporter ATP-binding protein/permease [Kitasatospora sp. A2-31]
MASPADKTKAADPLPSSVRALARSLRLGYQASPLLIVVAFGTTVAAAAPDALFAAGLAALLHGVLTQDDGRILAAALLLGALATGSWLLGIVSDRANRRFADRAAVYVESHVARLQSAVTTLEHHERPEHADRISVLRNHAGALSYLYQELFGTVGVLVRLAITLLLLMSVDPLLGLLGVLAVPGVLVSGWRSGVDKKAEEAGAQHERRARHLFTLATSAAAGKEIRVAGVQRWLHDARHDAWNRRYRPLARSRWTTAVWQAASHALFGAAFVLAVAHVAGGSGSAAADSLLLLTAGSRLAQYVGQTVTQTQFYRTIWLDVSRRLTWLEDLAAADRAAADLPVPARLTEGIRLERVGFRYPGSEQAVLEDVTLELPAGKVVAVVGENGAGKTTLVKLLCRFYAPTAGTITVDGADLARISPAGWRERISGAFQDFFKFEYPVRQSVGLGDLPRLDDPAAARAGIARAGAEELVDGLPDGLDTQLGPTWENGVDLSHGQWQKVALARGFVREEPLLLVLDEPTSALDAEVEHELFERYAEAARAAAGDGSGRITVLVSHRFSTVRMADVIVVLDGSRVAEYGSHAELMARGGQYSELYGIQAASYQAGARAVPAEAH